MNNVAQINCWEDETERDEEGVMLWNVSTEDEDGEEISAHSVGMSGADAWEEACALAKKLRIPATKTDYLGQKIARHDVAEFDADEINAEANRAIERSESHDEIVTIESESPEHEAALFSALKAASDDYTVGNNVTEFWKDGADPDNGEMIWRVHLTRYGMR